MSNTGNLAIRRFERMLPGIAYQEHLRITTHRDYIMSGTPQKVDPEKFRLIGIITYDLDKKTVDIEKVI